MKSGGYPADDTKADDHGNLDVHAGDAHGDTGVHAVKSGGYPADDTKADDHGNLATSSCTLATRMATLACTR